jgi:hypothetical protein
MPSGTMSISGCWPARATIRASPSRALGREQLADADAERVRETAQGTDGGRGEAALDLADEPDRQVRGVRQHAQRQAAGLAQSAQPPADRTDRRGFDPNAVETRRRRPRCHRAILPVDDDNVKFACGEFTFPRYHQGIALGPAPVRRGGPTAERTERGEPQCR